jgi:hypothetical protein
MPGKLVAVGFLSLASFACDSKDGKTKAATPEAVNSAASGLDRPNELPRPPGRGLPPELKPPR